jgi:DNA-binding LacI/PurR family transcriptional regulator
MRVDLPQRPRDALRLVKKNNIPCMQHVADLAGVHRTTVSLALHNHPSIPESTRAKVRLAADKLGYRLNPLVSALMSSRRALNSGASPHTTLAFVTSSNPGVDWRQSQTLREQFAGAKEQARLQGYSVEEFPLYADGMTPARANQVLRNRGIIGLIVGPVHTGHKTLPLEWDQFAAVGIAFTINQPNIPRVGNDHEQSARLAIRECRRRGYRRIGLAVQRNILERIEEQWLAGFQIEHSYPKKTAHARPLIAEQMNEETFLRWIKAERPDVVIAGGDYVNLLTWLRRARYAVPGDVAVVSLDLHVYDGSVAGINQDSTRIGAIVADTLIGRLNRNERGALPLPMRIHVTGHWLEGSTLRPGE